MMDIRDSKFSRRSIVWMLAGAVVLLLTGLSQITGMSGAITASADSPGPTPDRLAEPELSDHPTEYELGRNLYWMHCMPCHGDYGQGLTDEFRELWPEDHQNCWGRGCHGGKEMDEGFPIPKTIPAVIFASGEGLPYTTPETLYEYLHSTHPPQSPGYLEEEEYRAMATFVLAENGLMDVEDGIRPGISAGTMGAISAAGALLVIVGAVVLWVRRNRSVEITHSHDDGDFS